MPIFLFQVELLLIRVGEGLACCDPTRSNCWNASGQKVNVGGSSTSSNGAGDHYHGAGDVGLTVGVVLLACLSAVLLFCLGKGVVSAAFTMQETYKGARHIVLNYAVGDA